MSYKIQNYQNNFQRLYNYFVKDRQSDFSIKKINEHETNYNIDRNFCEDCSVIFNFNIRCIKHKKFNYKLEISPSQINKNMLENIIDNFKDGNYETIDKNYMNIRYNLFDLIQKICRKMKIQSQTFFLSIYLLDVIFSEKNSFQIIKNKQLNYYKLAISCLLIASKFIEVDSFFYQLSSFIEAFENSTYYTQFLSKNELLNYEVIVLKLLNYKVNYFTIYDFISFFFCHGIIQEHQIEDLNDNYKTTKILEKIYIKSRSYLDEIIKKDISIKYNSLFLAIFILDKSINEVLNIEKNAKDNLYEIFEKIYKINYVNDYEYKSIKDDFEENQFIKKDYSPLSLNEERCKTQYDFNHYTINNTFSSSTKKIHSQEEINSIVDKYKNKYKDLYLSNIDVSSSNNLSNMNFSQNNILLKLNEDYLKKIHYKENEYNSYIPYQKYKYSNLLRYSFINNKNSEGELRKLKNKNLNKISINKYSNSFYENNSSKLINHNLKTGNMIKSLKINYLNPKDYNYNLGL